MPCSSLEQCLAKERYDKRLLSIQSHVVSGFVGNRCAVFPLQLHGFEVDSINSVQFSNHTEYAHGARGQRLNERDLAELFEGLRLNGLHRDYSHILTGYCGDPTFLRQIATIIRECREQSPKLIYVCDPVLGDHGKYYNGMPRELCAIYHNEILPLADVITPNAFELSELSGIHVESEADILRAVDHLHKDRGVRIIVVTSTDAKVQKASVAEDGTTTSFMYCYASERTKEGDGGALCQFRFKIPLIKGAFVGTGDLFAALLLVWLEDAGGNLCRAVRATISSMQAVLQRTSEHAFAQSPHPNSRQMELRLVQSRLELLLPKPDQISFTDLSKT